MRIFLLSEEVESLRIVPLSVFGKSCLSSRGILQDGANTMHMWAWEGSGKPVTGVR